MKGAETALLVATCVALLIGVILLVLLARYYKQIRSYLLNCLPLLEKGQSNENKQDKNAMQKDRPFKKTRKHFSAKTLPTSAVRPRIDDTAKSGSHRRLPTLLLNEEHEFTVPMLSKHPVQPTLSGQYNASYSRQDVLPYRQHGHQLLSRQPATSMTDVSMLKNRSSAVSFALDSSPDNMYLRPALHRTMSTPLAALNLEQIQVYRRTPNFEAKKCISDAELTDNDSLQHFKFVQPELYQAIRRRTVGSGDLGKILCSLKYKDDTKRTLNLILHRVNGLQPFGAYVQGLYVNIIMLPDRESIYQTRRLLRVEANLTFEDSFDFSSKPLNRDFESKTIRFVIRSIAKDSKESNYGEARIPLLSYEIYSQIPTDVSLNIAPLQEQVSLKARVYICVVKPSFPSGGTSQGEPSLWGQIEKIWTAKWGKFCIKLQRWISHMDTDGPTFAPKSSLSY